MPIWNAKHRQNPLLPEGTKVGDSLEVFCSLQEFPGPPHSWTVSAHSWIWGLEKDLLLLFKEQNHKVRQGENCLIALFVDKSQRLAATMNVYSYMSAESPYKKDDKVQGTKKAYMQMDEDAGAGIKGH